MLWYYINSVERSADIKDNSLKIDNQLQQRTDSCSFDVFQGVKPEENQDVGIYRGDKIASIVGATITLQGLYTRNMGIFYAGQILHIRIGDADQERCEVASYNESTLSLILTAAPSGSVVANDKIGEKIFGGVVSNVEDSNVEVLTNLEYSIECVDYTKVFDKKLISDTWEDRDARYIINDFINNFVNYNIEIDQLDYATNGDIQAALPNKGGAANPALPLTDAVSPQEANHWGVFSVANAGSAWWYTSTLPSKNLAFFTGAVSGSPVAGKVGLWIKTNDYTKITNLLLYLGSQTSVHYAYVYFSGSLIGQNNTPIYIELDLADAAVTGTPDWTAIDYWGFTIQATGAVTFEIAGVRILQDDYFRFYPYVEATPEFDDIRSPQLKPSALLQLMAKAWQYNQWIDYDRYIHFCPTATEVAPISLTNTSNNFYGLSIKVDESQLGNRIIVRGGYKPSDNLFAQVFQGDNALREWLMKNEFYYTGFTILLDNNTTTHAAEAGTTTTNIKITGHGLATGAHIVNRTRGVVRQITYVDPDNFTVETVASQTSGDTISYFSVSKTLGIDGVSNPASYDYLGNQDQKSIKASSATVTLTATDYIRFSYYEKIPIQLQYQDSASVTALRALGFGDGIFDLDPYTDRNIDSIGTALAIAQAKVTEYSNPIITGSFETDQCGVHAGQIVHITDTVRGIDGDYVVQRVKSKLIAGNHKDYFQFSVVIGTTLFGIIEFFQKLLSTQDRIELNTDEIVETYLSGDEVVESSDVNQVTEWNSGAWHYETSAGQPLATRFNLSDYA